MSILKYNWEFDNCSGLRIWLVQESVSWGPILIPMQGNQCCQKEVEEKGLLRLSLKDENWSHLESEPMLRIELRGTPFSLGVKLQPTILVLMPYKII